MSSEDEALRATIQCYLHVIAAEDSLLQSYRALFLAIEAVIFGLAYVLFETGRAADFVPLFGVRAITLASMFGVGFSCAWIFVCTHRACMVDRLKEKLRVLLESGEEGSHSELPDWFSLAYGEASTTECIKKPINMLKTYVGPAEKAVPRVCFNLLFPLFTIILWVVILVTTL